MRGFLRWFLRAFLVGSGRRERKGDFQRLAEILNKMNCITALVKLVVLIELLMTFEILFY